MSAQVNGLYDGVNWFDERFADLVTGSRNDLGDSGDKVAPLHVHHLGLCVDACRSDGQFDLLCGSLAHQHVVLPLDVVDDRFVHLVAASPNRARRDDA
jgi:hypothetical protein